MALRMESVKDGKSGGRETTQGAVAVIQVRADNCLADKSCLTFPDSTDSSPSGSSVPGISQARILEWAAISFSRESSQSSDHNHNSCMAGGFFTTEPPENAQRWLLVIESLSHVWLFVTPWSVARQAPLFVGFPRQEYWSGSPFLPAGESNGSLSQSTGRKVRARQTTGLGGRTHVNRYREKGMLRKGPTFLAWKVSVSWCCSWRYREPKNKSHLEKCNAGFSFWPVERYLQTSKQSLDRWGSYGSGLQILIWYSFTYVPGPRLYTPRNSVPWEGTQAWKTPH